MKKLFLSFFLSLCFFSSQAQTQIQAPLPNQTSAFTGNVRGYWFVAQSCFTITGAEVPTNNPGNQSIAIVRLAAPPPLFSATTNAFTTLFLTQNNPAVGILPTNIQVETGDIIGFLGCRGTTNSYSSTGNTTTIEGISTTLNRLGMQFQLPTTAPQNLWTEASGSISRVWLYYDSLITYNLVATPAGGNTYTFVDGSDSSFTSVYNYGDGSPLDTTWNPSHTYAAPGVYNVCSYITNACGTDTVCTVVTLCGGPPTASFSSIANNAIVDFSDLSTGAFAWSWDFGDGNSSTAQNPSHTYDSSGTYIVCLIADNGCSGFDTTCQSVTVCISPGAAYTMMDNAGTVTFTDSSSANPTSWFWEFGDGNTSNLQHPVHAYGPNGTYTVCLYATNSCGTDTICDTISVCPQVAMAGFTSGNSAGQTQFTDNSQNALSWMWDFGDGGTDTVSNPVHTYAANGMYNVCLIVMNGCSADTLCDSVSACPNFSSADFSMAVTGNDVTFTDLSTNTTGWSWDFGDTGTSSAQSPTHTYVTNGTFSICLVTTNSCSSDTLCDSLTLCPVALTSAFSSSNANLTYTFTNSSTGASSYYWDFGDGGSSILPNPSHTYAGSGDFEVCLTSWNLCGDSSTTCDSANALAVSDPDLITEVLFYPNPFNETANLRIQSPYNDFYELKINDLRGIEVISLTGRFNETLTIRRNGLAAGVYFYSLVKEGRLVGNGKMVIAE